MKKILFIIFFISSLTNAQLWQGTSGPSGGNVAKIVVDPSNSEIVYAIVNAPFSGVFKSTDGGLTWAALTNGLDFNSGSSSRTPEDLAIDITVPNILYVTINQPQSIGLSNLYRTTDGGETWYSIKTDMINSLCAKNRSVFALSDTGLLYSTDEGETWSVQYPSLIGKKVLLDGQNTLWIGGSNGLLKSIDSGNTFYNSFPYKWNINDFDIATLKSQMCIAASVGDSFYVSYDKGKTWANRTLTLPYDSINQRFEIPYSIKISRFNFNHIYAGFSQGYYRTTNGGINWEKQDSGLSLTHALVPEYARYTSFISSLEISPEDSNLIFAGTDNDGIYKSTDEGITWKFLSVPSGDVTEISVPYITNTDKIYCSSQGGLYYLKDNRWYPTTMLIGKGVSSYGITAVSVSPYNSNIIMTGTSNSIFTGILYKTTDAGDTWSFKTSTPFEGWFSKIVFDPVDSNRIYAAWKASLDTTGGGLLVSEDKGEDWQQIQKGFKIVDLTVDPVDNELLYVLGKWGGIYRSSDRGITWDTIRAETDSEFTFIKFDPTNSNRIYAGSFNLLVSEDRGITWTEKPFGKKITDLAIDSETGEIFMATFDDGVWRSSDYGNTFTKMPSLPSERISKIIFYIQGEQRILLAGTNGVGAYKYILGPVLSISNIEYIPKNYVLLQNYPNPFNPITTIEYAIPKQSFVNLSIYNILGKKVKTLVQRVQSFGKYSVLWNGKNENGTHVSSGVYFYILHAGGYSLTKKMIYLR